jgi:hypothetical protein
MIQVAMIQFTKSSQSSSAAKRRKNAAQACPERSRRGEGHGFGPSPWVNQTTAKALKGRKNVHDSCSNKPIYSKQAGFSLGVFH